jgi:hypothetical protein
MSLATQTAWLLLLAIPVACIAWTVTHEEVFREPREYCQRQSERCRSLIARKFFYLFTCEYCFSHYVAAAFVAITGFALLYPENWRGYLIAWFALVWVANIYMNAYARLRLDIKRERLEIKEVEQEVKQDAKRGQPHIVK